MSATAAKTCHFNVHYVLRFVVLLLIYVRAISSSI